MLSLIVCSRNSRISPALEDNIKKTIGEWIRVKQQRGYPDQSEESAEKILGLDTFFTVNERTPDKEEYARKLISNE